MFCIMCGSENPQAARFCHNCGAATSVEMGASVPAGTPTPPPSSATQAQPTSTPTMPPPTPLKVENKPAVSPVLSGAARLKASTSPLTIAQTFAIVEYTKRHDRTAIVLGILTAILVLLGTASIFLAVFAGAVVYLLLFAYLLPLVWRPAVNCPHCGKRVESLANALPKLVWPRSCPHCLREIAT